MRHTILILFTGLLLTLTVSCDNWLDVRPQTEVKVDDNFKTAQGFKDALTGIYLLMSIIIQRNKRKKLLIRYGVRCIM